MSVYDERPWLGLYDEGLEGSLGDGHPDVVTAARRHADAAPDRPCLHFLGTTLSRGEVDGMSDALAVALAERGVDRGDRVAIWTQNDPQFVLALLAAWKLGAIAVPVNPMYRGREFGHVLRDSGARALVALDDLHSDGGVGVAADTGVETVITTSPRDLASEEVPLLGEETGAAGTEDLLELVERHHGERPDHVELARDEVALLSYTSGTTGPPKGAMNTHGNVAFNAATYQTWMHLDEGDVCHGVAPLFHITGLIGHIAAALTTPMPLVLGHRFDPARFALEIERHQVTFTVGAITVFIALMNDPASAAHDLSSLDRAYSGGAPIAPATVAAFEDRFGVYIRNAYGLTETTSPSHCVPTSRRAPVDERTGALSVGVPVFDTVVRVVDEDGNDVSPGEIGEIVTEGPQVVPGYWGQPKESAHAIRAGRLHTGDVGFMDPDGWFYLVDRKKDQINAAGYKVWPREVEDVLYEHPAVREVGVVGVADPYRGETVKAYVSLTPRATLDEGELIAFARERLAAYKVPRLIEVLDELPKTVTGKILRRELRER